MFMNQRDDCSIGRYLVLAFMCGLSSGCAPTYRAPNQPASQLAVIVAGSDELAILAVDKLRTSSSPGTGLKQVAVLPGRHIILVQHKRNGLAAEGSLTLVLEAGRKYLLRSASKGYGVTFWIEDDHQGAPPLV